MYNYNAPMPDAARLSASRGLICSTATSCTAPTAAAISTMALPPLEAADGQGSVLPVRGTWARDLYDMTQWDTLENPHDRQRERAVAPDIPTLPRDRQHGLPAAVRQRPQVLWKRVAAGKLLPRRLGILGGVWLHSGQFLTPYWSGPDPTGIFYSGDAVRHGYHSPGPTSRSQLPYGQRTIDRWFDASAFAAPAKGRFGTSAKGVIKGPHSNSWNMGLAKETRFSERGPLLRMEIQGRNMFNHPNWSNPVTDITDGGCSPHLRGGRHCGRFVSTRIPPGPQA